VIVISFSIIVSCIFISLLLVTVGIVYNTAGSSINQWRNQEFCSRGGGVQQIELRTEDRENGDLGAVAP
jgi:hypothetical protein